MTTVAVTGTTQTVVVADTPGTAIVTVPSPSTIVSVDRVGPQGPQGLPGPAGLIVDQSAKVDQSIVYYDAGSGTFKADPTWTTTTIVDGANF
jgi:hypothetical protein